MPIYGLVLREFIWLVLNASHVHGIILGAGKHSNSVLERFRKKFLNKMLEDLQGFLKSFFADVGIRNGVWFDVLPPLD